MTLTMMSCSRIHLTLRVDKAMRWIIRYFPLYFTVLSLFTFLITSGIMSVSPCLRFIDDRFNDFDSSLDVLSNSKVIPTLRKLRSDLMPKI